MFGRTREKTHRQTHTHNKMTDQNNTAEVYDNENDFSMEVENFVDDGMDYSQDIDFSQDMGDHYTDDEPDCPVCGSCGCYDEECEMEIDRAEYQAQYWADF